MPVDFYYQIQLGNSYITDTGADMGVRAIADVDGLDAFEVDDGTDPIAVQEIRALSTTVYQQASIPIVDVPITITFPLLDKDSLDNITDEINSYIASPTPFTLVFTGTNRTFTGTGKPRWDPRPVSYSGTYQNDKMKQVIVRVWMSLS